MRAQGYRLILSCGISEGQPAESRTRPDNRTKSLAKPAERPIHLPVGPDKSHTTGTVRRPNAPMMNWGLSILS